MMKYIRADDLCAYALAAVGGGYCYGSSGEICSLSRRQQWAEWNPSQRENLLGVCSKWDGKRVWDCSGLFRGAWRALWKYRSGGATTIYNTWCSEKGHIDASFVYDNLCAQKGEIAAGTMPNVPGVLLFRGDEKTKQHIGLYLGDGTVVDARGSKQGVLHTKFQDGYTWTHWGLAEDVDYEGILPHPEEVPALWSGRVKTRTGNGISLWPAPNNTGKAIIKITESATVDIMSDLPDGGYIEARYGHMTGYVNLQYIVPPDAENPSFTSYMATVIDVTKGLNLRTSPDMGRNTILLIPPGRQVEAYPEMAQGGFAYVRYEGKTGYCTAAKLRRAAAEVLL